METTRIRVKLDDRHLLSESQRLEGLKRSWFLLKPELKSISDLTEHLTRRFELEDACPNGLILYMDGFVLPLFESIHILKDKDVVRVKRKNSKTDIIRTYNEENSLEDSEIVEKQPVLDGGKLLALIEHENLTSDNASEPKENEQNGHKNALHLGTLDVERPNSKKRKSSKNLQNTRGKKIRSKSPEKSPNILIGSVEKDDHMGNQGYDKVTSSQKKSEKKERSSKSNRKFNKTSTAEIDDSVENNVESVPNGERHDEVLENDKDKEASGLPECTEKFPSRSARRKKAKRKWLRELANSQKEEIKKPEEAVYVKHVEHQELDKDTEAEGELVPIVIRPGHIRFEPLGEGQVIQQTPDPLGNFQRNDITSKKKGQKWGIEKTSASRNNGYKSREDSIEKETWSIERSSVSKSSGYKESKEDFIENLTVQNGQHLRDPVDFEKLKPLLSTPKEGDVVAYRLVELSSALCPELTPFRVGKVSWFDSSSNKVMLVPVPGYPVTTEENRDEAIPLQSDDSLYGEDGSLEIDFPLLLDVRTVNNDHSNPDLVMAGSNESLASSKETEKPYDSNAHREGPNTGEPVNVWEELSQALSEKKTQMLDKAGWTRESSGRSSGSYRALRSSALGPTIAMLRASNGL